jgi:hypothetical protein
MSKFKSFFILFSFLLFSGCIFFPDVVAQSSFYKFPVYQEGIYKITQSQAQLLGAGSMGEISIFGYPGMLPQKLDSSTMNLTEVPIKEINGDLYFYLSAAPTLESENGKVQYQAHHYTDTLNYLIQIGRTPTKTIPSEDLPIVTDSIHTWLYQARIYKKEEFNILSSGRNWYGERVFNEETIILNFPEDQTKNFPFYFQGKFMAQSQDESHIQVNINNLLDTTTSLPPISKLRYGIKGTEAFLDGFSKASSLTENIQVKIHYQTPDRNGAAYLDYFILGIPFAADALPSGIYYNFAHKASVIEGMPSQVIWDISDFFSVKNISNQEPFLFESQKIAVFKPDEVVAISSFHPVDIDKGIDPHFSELLIITAPSLKVEADRLARFKNSIGINTQVVLVQDIYNSFGYGNPDVTAIRNFLAFQWHAGGVLQNVLLFGKGTFDYKGILGGRPNLIPTYSSRSSLNPLTTYSSDDYFGFLQFGEGKWEESNEGDLALTVGVGRLPVINLSEGRDVVEKIMAYGSPEIGAEDWKRKVLFVADDGDNNIHLKDAETLASHLSDRHPEIISEKLYLDAFEQQSTDESQKSLAARLHWETLLDSSFLLVNYIGHGNETTLMAEELFTVSDLTNWPENSRLPIFMTATCEFGRHDSPLIRSGAEELLVAKKKGAIALLSTGRPVFSNINFTLNKAFIENVFTKHEGQYRTLGDIFKLTKNNSLNGPLNRNFSLLGDPSLQIPLPRLNVQALSFLDVKLKTEIDTLYGMQQIRYMANIMDPLTGVAMDSFNGSFEILLADRPLLRATLGEESDVTHYKDEQTFLFRGQGEVINGRIEGEFLVSLPPEREIEEVNVRIFAKEDNSLEEAFGATKILMGGSPTTSHQDHEGPSIRLFSQNNEEPESPIPFSTVQLKAILEDPSGIYISPFHPPHSISLQINNGEKINLNAYYKALKGSFTEGILEFPVTGLNEGLNFLSLEVWDNYGNASSKTIEIRVQGSKEIDILSHVIFPNPSTSFSEFRLSHNRPGENLELLVQVFSLEGREIFSFSKRFPKANPHLDNISWIFMQSKTKYPAKGTYLYVLELKSEKDGSTDRESGKIIIL